MITGYHSDHIKGLHHDPSFRIEGQTDPETFIQMQKAADSLGNITLTQIADAGEHIHLLKDRAIVKVEVMPGSIGYSLVADPKPGESRGDTGEFWSQLDSVTTAETDSAPN